MQNSNIDIDFDVEFNINIYWYWYWRKTWSRYWYWHQICLQYILRKILNPKSRHISDQGHFIWCNSDVIMHQLYWNWWNIDSFNKIVNIYWYWYCYWYWVITFKNIDIDFVTAFNINIYWNWYWYWARTWINIDIDFGNYFEYQYILNLKLILSEDLN